MPRIRALTILCSCALLLAPAGCGDDDKKSGGTDLKRLLPEKGDLPSGYAVKTENGSSSANTCVGGDSADERELAKRFDELGLQACASRTFNKDENGTLKKHNTPGSTAILMDSETHASQALPILRKALLASYNPTGTASAGQQGEIPVSGLGDQSLPGARFTTDLGALGGEFELYLYVWRRGKVVVWLGSTNILGDYDKDSTLELAKKVDRRGAG
jgi:hypothetical protein